MGFTLNQLEQERQIRKLQKKEDKDTSNYEQLSNLPKINNVELKGDKTTGDLGINADNVMMSDGVTSVEEAVDEVASGLTNIIHRGNVSSGSNISIPGTDDSNVRMIIVKRASISVAAVVLTEYWSDTVVAVYGTLPAGITITKSQLSNDIVITNGTGAAIAYLVIN